MSNIAVAGHWELSWNSPIKEAELWNLLLRDFGVTEWHMWPVSGVKNNEWRLVNLIEHPDFNSILEANQDLTRVYVEPSTGISLEEFEHPENALYIFGSAHFNPVLGHLRDEDKSLFIPTIQNKGALWPHQCLTTILYDRLIKDGPWR